MAKDVIQIIDKETGEEGNVRDSRLALAKEKTAVALTDAIELRTIDDKQIFVKADSFFNAFAQWCKANNKSTITSLFGELTADGVSSPGSINMANLASVLSAEEPFLNILRRINSSSQDYAGPGIYLISGTSGNDVLTDDGVLIVSGQAQSGNRVKIGFSSPKFAVQDYQGTWRKSG